MKTIKPVAVAFVVLVLFVSCGRQDKLPGSEQTAPPIEQNNKPVAPDTQNAPVDNGASAPTEILSDGSVLTFKSGWVELTPPMLSLRIASVTRSLNLQFLPRADTLSERCQLMRDQTLDLVARVSRESNRDRSRALTAALKQRVEQLSTDAGVFSFDVSAASFALAREYLRGSTLAGPVYLVLGTMRTVSTEELLSDIVTRFNRSVEGPAFEDYLYDLAPDEMLLMSPTLAQLCDLIFVSQASQLGYALPDRVVPVLINW